MSTKKRDFVLICLFVCLSVDSCNSVDFRFEGFALVELGLLHDDGLLLLLRRHHHEHLLQQLGRVVCSLLVRIPTWNVSFKRMENKRGKSKLVIMITRYSWVTVIVIVISKYMCSDMIIYSKNSGCCYFLVKVIKVCGQNWLD